MNGIIFDFANEWSATHDSVGEAKDFALSEADWEAFVKFAQAHDATAFESRTQTAWNALTQVAKEEQFYAMDAEIFGAIDSLLTPSIERDLNRFKEEIVWALEEELVMRYHLQTGVIEWSLPRDATLEKAMEVMSDGSYLEILAGTSEPE